MNSRQNSANAKHLCRQNVKHEQVGDEIIGWVFMSIGHQVKLMNDRSWLCNVLVLTCWRILISVYPGYQLFATLSRNISTHIFLPFVELVNLFHIWDLMSFYGDNKSHIWISQFIEVLAGFSVTRSWPNTGHFQLLSVDLSPPPTPPLPTRFSVIFAWHSVIIA